MKTCSIIGHRNIEITEELANKTRKIIIDLIQKGVSTFLFGSKSEFNSLCYEIITEIKIDFQHIKRVFVRAEYPFVSNEYVNYLLEFYEDTFYFDKEGNSSKFYYIKRNEYLINNSDVCLFYFDIDYKPKNRTSSGTAISYNYAQNKKKEIINVAPQKNDLFF